MITLHLSLDLIPSGVLPRLNVSQYDHGQEVDVTLYEGSTAYTLPSGATVTVSGTKADNTGFEYNCTTTGGLSFTIADQMTVFAGEVECELTIRYGNNRISTVNFILDVERAALQDDVEISETDIPILQQIPEYAASASADADRAEQAAATAMSTDAGKVTDRLNLNNCRNLVVPADIEYTQNGVTMRTNADGSITLSGASTSSNFAMWADLWQNDAKLQTVGSNPSKWLPNGKYTLYGDTVGGRIVSSGTTLAYLAIVKCDASGNLISSYGSTNNGTNKNFTVENDAGTVALRLNITASADFGSGMTIYPMITTQSTTDVTGYEQGALSNHALTIKSEGVVDLTQRGRKQFQSVIGSSGIVDITFAKPFSTVPTVTFTLYGNADIPNVVHATLSTVSATGFKISWKNTGTSGQGYAPFINWIATVIGTAQIDGI